MKDYKGILETEIRQKFNIYLEAYSYRNADDLLKNLAFQIDVYKRGLEIKRGLK